MEVHLGLAALGASVLPSGCTLQSPAPHDPRIRGAALLVSWTKHKGVSCLAEPALLGPLLPQEASVPEYRPWAVSPWVGAHRNAGISPGKGSQCLGSELKWEKGSAERTDVSSSLFTHWVICVTALHTTSIAGSPLSCSGEVCPSQVWLFPENSPSLAKCKMCWSIYCRFPGPCLSTETWLMVCPIAHPATVLIDLYGWELAGLQASAHTSSMLFFSFYSAG